MPKDLEHNELHPGDEVIVRGRVTDMMGADAGLVAVSPIDREGDVVHPPVTLPSRSIKLARRRDAGASQQ